MQRSWLIFLVVFCVNWFGLSWGQTTPNLDLVLQAANDPLWARLLHVDQVDYSSKVLSPDFYQSKFFAGRDFLRQELLANLETAQSQAESYICRYPARYEFLKTYFKNLDLSARDCTDLQDWKSKLNVKSLSLVYPNHSMGSSLAVFSHTFFKLNSRDLPADSNLNIAISYAAELDPSDSLPSLALKGFLGGYVGKFGNSYYYEELNRYSESEYRDIYEYELNLDDQEIDRLLNHIWEVKDIQFRYFFLRGNCSFYLLLLLDIARPRLSLSLNYRFVTVPSESLKTVYFEPDLVGRIAWLPSKKTRQDLAWQKLSAVQKNYVRQTIRMNQFDPITLNSLMSHEQQVQVLDYLSLFLRDDKQENQGIYNSIRESILATRSALGKLNEPAHGDHQATDSDSAELPHFSHGAMAGYLGTGQLDGKNYAKLKYRFVLHSMLDPSSGYFKDTDLELAAIELKYFDQQKEMQFYNSKLVFANITVLKPDSLGALGSWQGSSQLINYGSDRWNLKNNIAFGKSMRILRKSGSLFLMMNTDFNLDSGYKRGHQAIVSPLIGANIEIGSRHKFRLESKRFERPDWEFWYAYSRTNSAIQLMFGESNSVDPSLSITEKKYEASYALYF